MSGARRPPRLLAKTIFVTFSSAALLIATVFATVVATTHRQMRQAVREHLESSQRLIAAIENREQQAQRLQAANLAENPTLKAAVDTYAAERHTADPSQQAQLLTTIERELAKVVSIIGADAVVVTDIDGGTLAAAGRFASVWPVGQRVTMIGAGETGDTFDGVVHLGTDTFRVLTVPLRLSDDTDIGALYVATSLDHRFATQLGSLARSDTVILSENTVVASTLAQSLNQQLETSLAAIADDERTVTLNGEDYAARRLARIGDTQFFALTSIDAAAGTALADTTRALALIAVGTLLLALIASVWLAHSVSKPIRALAASIQEVAASRQFSTNLPNTGSSLEVDELTETFNLLMTSVVSAESETTAAYTGAIRALAASLDARDTYTAGHSERVSALAVATGKAMGLSASDLEVIRLGALLHDIGKIGVPDEILRKPGALTREEFDAIKMHPLLGARILRTVPFFAPYIPVVELHHERPDGRGYPYGLHADQIPTVVHIVHVVDAYDAMTSARAYRPGRPPADALAELWATAGTEFHAEAVAALASIIQGVGVANPRERMALPEALSA